MRKVTNAEMEKISGGVTDLPPVIVTAPAPSNDGPIPGGTGSSGPQNPPSSSEGLPTTGGGGSHNNACISPDQAQTVMSWANSEASKIAFGSAGAALAAFLTDGLSLTAPAAATLGSASTEISYHLGDDVASSASAGSMEAYNNMLDAADYIGQILSAASDVSPASYYAYSELSAGNYQQACADLGIN